MPRVILGIKLYDMQETADLLGVMKETVSKYSQNGKINSAIIGKKRYFSEDNIKDFLQNR